MSGWVGYVKTSWRNYCHPEEEENGPFGAAPLIFQRIISRKSSFYARHRWTGILKTQAHRTVAAHPPHTAVTRFRLRPLVAASQPTRTASSAVFEQDTEVVRTPLCTSLKVRFGSSSSSVCTASPSHLYGFPQRAAPADVHPNHRCETRLLRLR